MKVDDRARCHPKFFRAGCLAFGWWNAGLGYCNELLTNGFIAIRDLELVFPGMLPADREQAVESLVREGLLHTVSKGQRPACGGPLCRRVTARQDGYLMHDYLVYQPSKHHVKTTRSNVSRVRAESGRRGGLQSGKARRDAKLHEASLLEANEAPSRPVPSRPVPKDKDLTTLSGSPPDGAVLNGKPSQHLEHAREVLAFLNTKATRAYRPVDENLRLIAARLKSGATVEDCRGVIARKCREWNHAPEPGQKDMRKFLRPATLFAATNFEQYLGEQGHGG